MTETAFLTWYRAFADHVELMSGVAIGIGVATQYWKQGLTPKRAAVVHASDRFWR